MSKLTERAKAENAALKLLCNHTIYQAAPEHLRGRLKAVVGDLILRHRQERKRERMMNYRNQEFYENKIKELNARLQILSKFYAEHR